MRAMQENQSLYIRIKRMKQKAAQQSNDDLQSDADKSDMRTLHKTGDSAPKMFAGQSGGVGTKLQQCSESGDFPDRENLGKRMSDILVGALRASKRDKG